MANLILIVDEDELERCYVAALLAADGFDVMQAERALEGMVAVTAIEPSLVILASGSSRTSEPSTIHIFQLVRVFRRITNAPLAIIGDPQPSDELASLISGGDFFLPRGFSASEMISRCRMLMRREGDVSPPAMDGELRNARSGFGSRQTIHTIMQRLNEGGFPNGREAA